MGIRMKQPDNCYNKFEFWLAGISSISGRKKIYLKSLFPQLEELYQLNIKQIQKIPSLTEREKEHLKTSQQISDFKLEEELEYCIQNQIKLILWEDKEYPSRLKHIYNPPYGLYYRGNLPKETKPAIAIVGARNCSLYGKKIAEAIGFHLAKNGVSIISGMALGIDGASHQGALQAKGKTYGILGSGIDVCYPARNKILYEKLQVDGGVISEYPPHTQPLAMFFPQRNRIISGLSDGIVVVEAKAKSGSLITADFALEQGKEIYAVPGRIDDTLSQGTNQLIRQGAGIFLSIEDFQREMNIFVDSIKTSKEKQKIVLAKLERLVYHCLSLNPKNLEELILDTGLSFAELIENLESLREKGCILEVYKNYFIRSDISDFV